MTTRSRTLAPLLALLFWTSTACGALAETTHTPRTAGELTAILKAVKPGDTITLAPGTRYVGQFNLPAVAAPGARLISGGTLPERRVTPADAPQMATIFSGHPAFALGCDGCTNWTIDGIRLEANVGGFDAAIAITRGVNIRLDRILLVVPSTQELKRGITGNGANISLTRSHLAGIWRAGQDSQAFAAWDGSGPYTIRDNFLEAASENVMFGGADSSSPASLPSDILVEGNHFHKPLEWKGHPKVVKNLFELKAARRVVIRNNLFENHWVDAQSGPAIVFTPRNQDGKASWSVIEDVLFERNILRSVSAGFSILGFDDNGASRQTTGIVIRHNLVLGTGGGRFAMIGNEAGHVTFDHNTFVQPQTGSTAMMSLYAEGSIKMPDGTKRTPAFAVQNLVVTNNILQSNTYGVHSSNAAMGVGTLKAMTSSYKWVGNALIGGVPGQWTDTDTIIVPVGEGPAHFDPAHRLVSTSSLKRKAAGGQDPGWAGPAAGKAPPVPNVRPKVE